MRSRPFITANLVSLLAVGLLCVATVSPAVAQRIAIIAPERTALDLEFVEAVGDRLSKGFKVLDESLASTAFKSAAIESPYNMTVAEARSAAAVIGCDYLVLLRTGDHRRTSLSNDGYHEAFVFVYLVNGRSGELLSWVRYSTSRSDREGALRSLRTLPINITAQIWSDMGIPRREPEKFIRPVMEEVPPEGSPASVGLKPPIPYRRFKPEYTSLAFMYDVRATVDAEVDVDADGSIKAVRFVRWAGFDLERSVEKAIRSMNWRPAMRNGTALPMRILLRYNFTKVEKE